ncbi:MAG: hypothetical protein ACOYOU_22180, partial [Kiritimatiellia bacterium]
LTLIPVSATLFAMTSLRQIGYGMISALAGRRRSKAADFQTTRRHSLGTDIGAACGQLAEESHSTKANHDASH